MGIANLLVGDSQDLDAAEVATTAVLDGKRDAILSGMKTAVAANTFLDPSKMNDVITDYLQGINGGVPSDKA